MLIEFQEGSTSPARHARRAGLKRRPGGAPMPGFRDRSVKLASAVARNRSAVSKSACSPRYTYCSTRSRLALAR